MSTGWRRVPERISGAPLVIWWRVCYEATEGRVIRPPHLTGWSRLGFKSCLVVLPYVGLQQHLEWRLVGGHKSRGRSHTGLCTSSCSLTKYNYIHEDVRGAGMRRNERTVSADTFFTSKASILV